MGIGTTIRDFRKQRGLTLNELSNQLGISSSFLSAVERETKKPSVAMVRRLSNVLNISPTYLFGIGTEKVYGEKIQFIRRGRSLSIEELSELSGIPVEKIEAYENSTEEPDLETLDRLAEALSVTVRYFLEKSADTFSVGTRVRHEREKQGLTGVLLADKAGISPAMVSQVENDQAEPSLDTLENIAQALGVSVCYFLLEQEDVENLMSSLNSEVLSLLGDPRIQAVLRAVRDLEAGDLKFILNYIQFFRRNRSLLDK
ncbi:helix-turn-helix domain-containing protein [Desulfitobacterium metallireducens]|uniref:DNA-binding protein n=1 Tax=Desulfitobacterium metallireducens DSM 15288 TaxID=871968 RepID=W0E5D1_9FIRM|nr:helix-turn-helix domain-containing protein [Desulfitobacterium metallireducens]AHF05967.1 DNA-binding protein [Desulfitobacterium metallireducens DSM 15288]